MLSIMLILSAGLRLSAQSFLDRIALEEGLSQSQVQCMLQDSRGFAWFGTQHGLNRYDGYEVKHFYQNPFDATTLSNDNISVLYEDSQQQLWVGTNNGLNRYNPVNQSFVQYDFLLKQVKLPRNRQVTGIAEDRWKTLWVSTLEGVWRLIPTKDSFQIVHFVADSTKMGTLSHNRIINIAADHQGNIWLATASGLNQAIVQNPDRAPDQQLFNFQRVTSQLFNPSNKIAAPIHRLYVDHANRLWFTSFNRLFIYHLQNKTWQELTNHLTEPTQQISSLLVDRFGVLWLGTFTNGLFRYKIEGNFELKLQEHIQENVSVKKGLKSNSILSLHESNELDEDIVWIGTREAGVQLYSRSKNSFHQWDQVLAKENTAASNAVFSICTDSYGALWIGTLQGLFQIDQQNGTYQKYLMDAQDVEKNAHQAVYEDTEKNLWVGSNGGLFRLVRSQGRFEQITLPPVRDKQPGISRIYEDNKKNLWIGTFNYLLKINLQDGSQKVINQIKKEKNTWQLPPLGAIQADRQGNIWIGTSEGLILFHPDSGEFTRIYSDPKNPKSLIDNSILDIHCSEDGQVWICSPKGLSKLIWENGKATFKHFTEKDGLANSFVYGALSDQRKRLWISTNAGISCFNPKTNDFRNYDSNDGLANREFNSGAFHQSKTGELYFGGMGVLVSFHPEQMTENQHFPRMVITAFRKMEQPLPFDSLLAADGKIQLKYNDDLIAFQLAALDFTNPGKNQYAYRLEGLQDNWVYNGTQRFISFPHLRPGDYKLHLKSANNQGVWNESETLSIPISIKPPFWQTWWFIGVATFFTGIVVVSSYRYRVRSKINRALELERVKLEENERVRKLAAQDLHDEFGNTLTRISLLTELIKAKTKASGDEVNGLLTKISDNTSRMYQGTKDFIWSINPENDSFYEVAIRLKDFGDDAFDKTGIAFQASGIDEQLKIINLPMGTSRHLVMLFKEAMSNTLRHAQATDVCLRFSIENGRAKIEWRDNGIGFNPENTKPGNGLQNMRSRAKRIHGQVRIESAVNAGTTVMLEV